MLERLMDGQYFPVRAQHLSANICVHEIQAGDCINMDEAEVKTWEVPHNGPCFGYRITDTTNDFVLAFSGDCELSPGQATPSGVIKLLQNADIALVDAPYTTEEYDQFAGWGHSTYSSWLRVAEELTVKHLIFSHHAPDRTDKALRAIFAKLQPLVNPPMSITMAREGMVLSSTGIYVPAARIPAPEECPVSEITKPINRINPNHALDKTQKNTHRRAQGDSENNEQDMDSITEWLGDVSRELMRYDDISIILDRILFEARTITNADAGTIYLVEDNALVFAYTHNDSLFPVQAAYKHAYSDAMLPLNTASIAGYCVVKDRAVNLANVRELPPDVPFTFNDTFDNATGYRTVSVHALPLHGRNDTVLGVMQLINSMEAGFPVPFSEAMASKLQMLGVQAVSALERGIMAKDMIRRMQMIAALNDPTETGSHAERVGAIAAEIYQRWAETHHEDPEHSRLFRNHLRLAAMLHDLGKVAIPNEVLKKPGRLTTGEFDVIRTHCAHGAKLFPSASVAIDVMAHDIALHHHQRWDGKGYTGDPDIPILAGEAIPFAARITSVADVFDALTSRRCYKEPWPWDKAIEEIRNGSGTQFDPEMVEAFLQAEDLVAAILKRYPDEVPA